MRKINFFLIYSFILILSKFNLIGQDIPGYIPTNGLVGWWPFNGNANDESGNGNNGVVNGAVLTTDRFGKPNSAYYFSGDNSIDCGKSNTLGLDKNTVLTISFWTTSKTNNWPFIKKYVNNYPVFSNYALGTNGRGILFTGDGTDATDILLLNDTSWIHICAIYKGISDSILIYVNGNFVKKAKLNFANTITSTSLVFGPRINMYYPYPDGKLDDIGIWNRALTEEEIRTLYQQNCQVTISTSKEFYYMGETATLNILTNIPNPTSYTWQSDFGQGFFINLIDYNNYSGTNTNTLTIEKLSLRNHMQSIMVKVKNNDQCPFGINSNVALIKIINECIFIDTFRINVTDTLTLNIYTATNPQFFNKIKIYPNPAKTSLTIHYGNYATMNGYSLQIINSNGTIIFSDQINSQSLLLNITDWSKGLYLIKIVDKNNNAIEIKKLVIK